ncbi:MAG TPA: 2Fe-2S iron-sulfur cluster-binding protein [Terriglobales bacterium]|nr:2Fe-2S iron-sulfur cluster-binding protein [Terriglobales bacterium]
MPKLTIDGKEIEVPAGTNLIEAARRLGIEVPHYCYHPGLSIAGQCRLCMVDIEKTPRPTIACNTQAADGMVVHTQSERVKETRRSIMEFHLINHPLDCPVCDQAGECWLQIYYMKHGLYDPRMTDEKVHKPKAVPLGPHVMLDAERCILCSRCVRFCDEVTHTGELGIFHRGDHSEIGLFPGADLTNKYSGNVVDICPVGALTDRDFRFQVRVWYLDTTKSVCPNCARGCNIDVHVNRRRPHHAEGKRVARLKPRFNEDVNRWWMCDEGRYGYDAVDAPTRIAQPAQRDAGAVREVGWDAAIGALAAVLGRVPAEETAIIASPKMANEDLFALRTLAEARGVRHVGFRVPPPVPGDEDDFLIRADKNPNTRGAELMGLDGDVPGILAAARAGRVRALLVFEHDLFDSAWPEAEVDAALAKVETLVFIGPNGHRTSERAHLVLPAAAWVERDGTFTNFQGRVQRFRPALAPLAEALPTWDIVGRVLGATGAPATATRAEHWFRALAAAVPAFGALTYQAIGDTGAQVLEGVRR